MKRNILTIVLSLILSIGIMYAGVSYIISSSQPKHISASDDLGFEKVETVSTHSDGSETVENKYDIPSEEKFMQVIHEMTHQKVIAVEKWGSIQITDERISEMLEILKEADYVHHDFYYETLSDWKDGVFTNVVDVHNQIWKWQGGSVGRALRRMTPEEEQSFIEIHFES